MKEKPVLRCDEYPGYEWIAEIQGTDFMHTMRLVEGVLDEQRIGTFSPGTMHMFATLMVLERHASRARELIRADVRLKGRWLAVLDETGVHYVR